jgi:phosphatidylglycerophosphate synthase
MPEEIPSGRRPLKSRSQPIFKAAAAALARRGVTPNAISAMSIVFGVLAGVFFASTASIADGWQRFAFFAAAAMIQFRLLCNMLDGMVAVEHARRTPSGELWNEVPDRISDVVTILGAGLAIGGDFRAAVVAAVLAMMTAYVRALGASVGAGQCFLGWGSKPQRMAILTVAALGAAMSGQLTVLVTVGLALICVLALVTVIQRLRFVAAYLKTKA